MTENRDFIPLNQTQNQPNKNKTSENNLNKAKGKRSEVDSSNTQKIFCKCIRKRPRVQEKNRPRQ